MKKSRFSESQIIRILKEADGGRKVIDVCREYGVSQATYYRWKSKYGGMEASDIRRLRELSVEVNVSGAGIQADGGSGEILAQDSRCRQDWAAA